MRTTCLSFCACHRSCSSYGSPHPPPPGLTAEEAEEKAKAEELMRAEQGEDDDEGDYKKSAKVGVRVGEEKDSSGW